MALSRTTCLVFSFCIAFVCAATKYPPEPNPSATHQQEIRTAYAGQGSRVLLNPDGYDAQVGQSVVNGVWFTTWMCATLDKDMIKSDSNTYGPNFRGSASTSKMTQFTRSLGGVQTDVAGHIIAHILGFPGNKQWNMVPIGSLNNSKMSAVELQIRDLVNRSHPAKTIVYMKFRYTMANVRRPTDIDVLVYYGPNHNRQVCYWNMLNPNP